MYFQDLIEELKAKYIALQDAFQEQYKVGQLFKHVPSGDVYVLGRPFGGNLSFIHVSLHTWVSHDKKTTMPLEPHTILQMQPIDSLADGFALTEISDVPF